MPVATHRVRYLLLALVLTWMALMLLTRPAHGAWSADPVEVHATTALCPAVAAAPDGHYGALVVWQENTASGGLLKARHLLANGDLDPAWSAPAAVSDKDAARVALGAVSDGAGGAYVWWMEGSLLALTRITAGGAVASGWPARGRVLGALVSADARPVLCSDHGGGVYAAWLATGALLPWPTAVVRAFHLGPDNLGTGGWPAGGRTLAAEAGTFGIATAPDGGLWLAFATTPTDETGYQAGEVRVTRLDAAGVPLPGWTPGGVAIAPYRADLLAADPYGAWGFAPDMRLAAVEEDRAGGAFALFGVVETSAFGTVMSYRLQRVNSTGGIAQGWPADGVRADPLTGLGAWDGRSAETSLQLHGDLRGGVFAGHPEFYDHGVSFSFDRFSAAGAHEGDYFAVGTFGLEAADRGDGGVVASSVNPVGPYGPYSPYAYLQVNQSDPGGSFLEYHPEPVLEWYGDAGLAATGDGGAIFAWSQLIDRQGVYAIRLGQAGVVTGVPPTPVVGPPSLRVRFVRGEGVHAVASFSGSPRLTLALHDLAGRRVASMSGDATLGADVVLPGTRDLPGGVYFARASDGTRVLNARVIVLP